MTTTRHISKTPPQIVINLSGGVVQDVLISDSSTEVEVVDWDDDPDSADCVNVPTAGGSRKAWVYRPSVFNTTDKKESDCMRAVSAARKRHDGKLAPDTS